MRSSTTTLAAQMQKEKELDEQLKTQLACLRACLSENARKQADTHRQAKIGFDV